VRHYFGYDINGILSSVETYGPAGWPANLCMENPECLEDAVTSLRVSRAKNSPNIVNWVVFDCPCDPGQGALLKDCPCVGSKFAESYVDTTAKVMIPKPMRTVYVDGVVVQHMDVITREPGTKVILKLVADGLPDGAKAVCSQKGQVDLTLEDEWELLFTAGKSDTKELTTPAQGTKGVCSIGGDLMRPLAFLLRGFAAP
jgi:hypothetical protein